MTVPRSSWFKNLGGDDFGAGDSGQGLGGNDVSGDDVGGMRFHSRLAAGRPEDDPEVWKLVFRKARPGRDPGIMPIKKRGRRIS
jgi:hypothetical protein